MNSAVAAAATSVRSILDKPLRELTEGDISQITREDCRRFLKEKGMRRPSWNKSQAIQQVISLKALLEPPPPSPASLQPPPAKATAVAPPQISAPYVNWNSSSSVKELSPADGEAPVSMSAEEGATEPPVGPSGSKEVDSAQAAVDHRADSLRDKDVLNLPVGQMAIFYCGQVNVYDGVPAVKAQAIMQLAASPIQFLHGEPFDGNFAKWGTLSHFRGSSIKVNVIPAGTTISHPVQTGKTKEYIQQHRQEWNVAHEADVDGQTSRQVSLQRYLEKRKDRGRFKIRKKIGPSSSGLEMYLNEKMRIQVVSGQSNPRGVSCPTQPVQSHVQCSFIENQSNNAGCAADLNDKGNQQRLDGQLCLG